MRMTPAAILFVLTTLAWSGWTTSDAHAFDYLEHSYFTDTACHRAQLMLGKRLADNQEDSTLMARYLALGIFCPASWTPRYCQSDEKLAVGSLHDLDEPPLQSKDVSLTLGDYAALPDHFARFGPVKGLPLAGTTGLWEWTAGWMTRKRPGGVGGTVEDVAENACETDDLPDWTHIDTDITLYLERAADEPVKVPESLLSPMARASVPRGPSDPAGVYSFDNPHYLDLILRNHNHFGVQAFSSWMGFHGAANSISARQCQDTLALDDWRLHRIARRVPGFEEIDFGNLPAEERAQRACALIGEVVRQRLKSWRERADETLTCPASAALDLLLYDDDAAEAPLEPEQVIFAARLLEQTTSAVMGLVFEGSGLHFLQDGLAAGHMRTIRTRGGLQEARHDHNLDNRHGVVAVFRTRQGSFPFVAFGDSFLLGPQDTAAPEVCEGFEQDVLRLSGAQVSMCLIQHQRGVLTAASMSSLLDWALGGTLYGVEEPTTTGEGEVRLGTSVCQGLEGVEHFICGHLPSRATFVAGEDMPQGVSGDVMHQGSLPVPPPPFSYEALTTRIGFDVQGRAPQVNVSFTVLSELDDLANWLTSYRFGVTTSIGDGIDQQGFMDLTYSFHWRWAARFLVDAGASAYAGFRDFNENPQFFTGVSPVLGVTLLPEGWSKMPVEFSLSYRLPVNIFVGGNGAFRRPVLGGNWVYAGFGLAFTH